MAHCRHCVSHGAGKSIAFFLDPNPEALVAAIPSCVPADEAPRHAPITTHDYLQQRFAATYGR